MDWWIWVVIGLAVLAAVASSVVAVQARRRSGDVIAGGTRPRGGRKGRQT
ncbi:hypothetical protein [Streptomyces wuyuanensis]|uniref:Uncharacterized protein n=1 Tax=Streptomyces wuyuanensis TaxID=1196353 RepID=A0A1G9YDQ6_9ACTN|nr:hypothetical protein [Streptomyces wuyuanensis]SDN06601.1 hypothetical protein SAMN05444921_11860 [Streptomyces wuyuanensis]